jgi:V8-like Glu-specific endopeptidase
MGTGFVVKGADLHPSLQMNVLITNAHVVSDELRSALPHDRAFVTFWGLDRPPPYERHRITRTIWSSLPHELDTTIVELDGLPAGVATCPLAGNRPLLDPAPQTFIIGHPKGWEQPMFSIQDNYLLDADDTMLHYRTPTEEGSSGSPVFNELWELIALHHRGLSQMPRLHGQAGTYPANEGIWIETIKAKLRAEL